MTTPSLDTSDTKVWDCDLLVVGSGAGALSTAVTAAHLGLKVIVVEKDAHYGGTTAWSGGWMWIPRNPLAIQAGITEPIENHCRICAMNWASSLTKHVRELSSRTAHAWCAFSKNTPPCSSLMAT